MEFSQWLMGTLSDIHASTFMNKQFIWRNETGIVATTPGNSHRPRFAVLLNHMLPTWKKAIC
jgi:hypothetical protein